MSRGTFGAQLEAVTLLKLGPYQGLPTATKVPRTALPSWSDHKVPLRIAAPFCYRQFFRTSLSAEDSPNEVVQAFTAFSGVRVLELLGGSWKQTESGPYSLLVGFLRVKARSADLLLQASGLRGVQAEEQVET